MSRTNLKLLTRVLYASGSIILLVGLLLSTFSKPAAASAAAVRTDKSTSATLPMFGLIGPSVGVDAGNPTGASLRFEGGCSGSCALVTATLCNYTDASMVEAPAIFLYYSPNGNPKTGEIISSGTFGPLPAYTCTTLTHKPSAPGSYMWLAYQESTHPGTGELWSDACSVAGMCTVEVTETPTETVTETPTETVTETPAETPTEQVTETPTVEVTETPTEQVTETPTVEVTETPIEQVTETPTVEVTETPIEQVTETPADQVTETPVVPESPNIETAIPTLAPPPSSGTTAVLIPVTGIDLSNPAGGRFASLFTNLGLLILGLALVLTGVYNRLR
jgi:YqxM protein